MKYKYKIGLLFICLVVMSFLLLNFVFGNGEKLLSSNNIIIYLSMITAILITLFSKNWIPINSYYSFVGYLNNR